MLTRICPFHGCGQSIPAHMFACRSHWFRLSKTDRAYEAWREGEIDGTELRRRQQIVLGTRGQA